MRPSPLYPWLIAAVTAVFTAAVVWAVDSYRDPEARLQRERARQERERVLAEFEQPCDPQTMQFDGQLVAVWLDRIRNGPEFERYEAVIALRCVYAGWDLRHSRGPYDWGHEAAYELVAAGHRSRRAVTVVPSIAAALDDPSAMVRETAAVALRDIGPAAVDAVDALRRALGHADGRTRVLAAQALFAVIRQTDESLAAMAHVLAHDPAPEHRSLAAWSIGFLGDRRGLAALNGALADPDDDVRQHASDAWKVLPRDRERRPAQR